MPIQGSGEIRFSQIATQFSRPLSPGLRMRLFYRGGGIVPDISENSNVPASGEIRFSRFFAAQEGEGDGSFTYRGIRFDADGWAIPSQFLSQNARIVYVSNTGDDTLAANNQYGRGYYNYDDAEIGADPTQPIGEVYAYQTLDAARVAARHYPSSVGRNEIHPDWILFKRGDTFDLTNSPIYTNLVPTDYNGGISASERRVYAAYGDPALADRPKIIYELGNQMYNNSGNYAFLSLEFVFNPNSDSYPPGAFASLNSKDNIFIEDVKCRAIGGFSPDNRFSPNGVNNLFVRRCIALDSWNPNLKGSQGIRIAGGQGLSTISECLIDNCSYHDDPRKPNTWTGAIQSAHRSSSVIPNMPAGTGVQPFRSFYDRSGYLSSYDDLLFENNIVSRGGGGGSVQMRCGGVARGNAFLWNHLALSSGHREADRDKSKNFEGENNLILHDDHFHCEGQNGSGLYSGSSSDIRETVTTARSNIILHFHGKATGGPISLGVGGGNAAFDANRPETIVKLARAFDNTIVQLNSAQFIGIGNLTESVQIGNNEMIFAVTPDTSFYSASVGPGAVRSNPKFEIGNELTGGNHIYAPNWTSYTSTWQAAGKDIVSTTYTSIEDMTTSRGWAPNAVNEDIVTYMQSLHPSYVPDEEMTVDDLVQIAPEDRRPDAPKVWFVLRNPSLFSGATPYTSGGALPPTDEQAKLIARRLHAFNYFMSFARQNRKGNWNPNYTAKGINNYFRALYNKPLI